MSQSPGSDEESHSHHTYSYDMYRKQRASRDEVDKPTTYPAKSPPKSPSKPPAKSPAKSPPKSPPKSTPKSPPKSTPKSPPKSPPKAHARIPIPLEEQTSSLMHRIFAHSRSNYTSEPYECTDRDCELGSRCDGEHSYSNETLRLRFGIVPPGMPPADSDYWPHNWYRRQARKQGLPRSYDNVDSDFSDSNDDDGGCSPSKKTKSPNDSDNESKS